MPAVVRRHVARRVIPRQELVRFSGRLSLSSEELRASLIILPVSNYIQQYARSEYHTQLAKMSFDKFFDLTAGVHFYFYIILCIIISCRIYIIHIIYIVIGHGSIGAGARERMSSQSCFGREENRTLPRAFFRSSETLLRPLPLAWDGSVPFFMILTQ